MTWTDNEWGRYAGLLEFGYPGEFSDEVAAAYRFILDDVTPEEAVAALKQLAGLGRPYRPAAFEIQGAVEALRAPAPTFDEVWLIIHDALAHAYGKSEEELLERIAERAGRFAAGWVALYGVDRLKADPIDDPIHGGGVVHRLRGHFTEVASHPETRRRAVQRFLELPLLPRITSGEPRRLDTAHLVGVDPA